MGTTATQVEDFEPTLHLPRVYEKREKGGGVRENKRKKRITSIRS